MLRWDEMVPVRLVSILVRGVLVSAAFSVAACPSRGVPCAESEDCPPGWICRDEACVKLCDQHTDCWPPAVTCRDGTCQPTVGTRCLTFDDCGGLPTVDLCSDEGRCVCAAVGAPCLDDQLCSASGCNALGGPASGIGITAGGGRTQTPTHQLELFVAPATPVGEIRSPGHVLRLGPIYHRGQR